MGETHYPLFSPPADLAAIGARNWSRVQAQAYFKWLLAQSPLRISRLLQFVDVHDRSPRDSEILALAGARVAELLNDSEFASGDAAFARTLTNRGYALAADMGLLTAQTLIDGTRGHVQWAISRGPKKDVNYNMPVLTGFGKRTFDPVGGSIAEAMGILLGRRDATAWIKGYDYWAALAADDSHSIS